MVVKGLKAAGAYGLAEGADLLLGSLELEVRPSRRPTHVA